MTSCECQNGVKICCEEGIFVKRKGILGAALALVMLLSVIPVKVTEASPYTVSTWEDWLIKSEEAKDWANYGFDIDATHGFEWPEEEVTMVIDKELYFSGDWVIPSNVTVIVKAPVHPDIVPVSIEESHTSSLTIYGTWHHSGNQAKIQEMFSPDWYDHAQITVENGGRFIIDEDTDHQQFPNLTVKNGGVLETNAYGTYIGLDSVLELEAGASVTGNGSLRLDGTVHGEGAALDCDIRVWGGYMGEDAQAVLSGTLTVSGIIELYDSSLTIPAGSDVTCNDSLYTGVINGRSSAINIAGNLNINNSIQARGGGQCTVNLADTGSLTLAQDAYIDTLSPNMIINGSGTLKLYGELSEDGSYVWSAPSLVVDSEWGYIEENLPAALEKGYIADTVHIWKSWQCDHQWVKGAVTEPTCSSEGYTTYTCSLCGSEKKDDYTDKLPHTPDGNTDCTKDSFCTVCGELIRAAGEHTYDAGTVKTEPTCTEPGVMEYTCEVCGSVKTEEIPAAGHDWKEVTGDDDELLAYRCEACGKEQTILLEAEQNIDVSLSVSAVETLAAQAEAEGYEELRIVAEPADEEMLTEEQSASLEALTDDALLIRVTLEAVNVDAEGNEEVTALHELGGEAQISAAYEAEDLENRVVKTVYLAEDGKTEDMKTVYEDGVVTFTTTHFSDYAVYTEEMKEDPEPEDPTKPQDPSDQNKPGGGSGDKTDGNKADKKDSASPNTGDDANVLLWAVCMAAAAACAAGAVRRGKRG